MKTSFVLGLSLALVLADSGFCQVQDQSQPISDFPPDFSYEAPPATISKRIIQEHQMVRLKEIPLEFGQTLIMMLGGERTVKYIPAPIATGFFADDQPITNTDVEAQNKFFKQDTFATIPKNSKIRIRKLKDSPEAQGREVWEYPVGTLLAHRIQFRTPGFPIYEVRLVWLNAQKNWVFAVYTPSSNSHLLTLNTDPPKTAIELDAIYPKWNPEARTLLRFNRVNTQQISCQGCHFSNSPAQYQYPSKQNAGPCGFAPTNPYVRKLWEPEFIKTRGLKESPFQN